MIVMNRKEVLLVLKQLNVSPNKRLGQNFLIDKNIANKIISISEISKKDVILEIGPGLGALTGKLVESAKKVYAVEIDPRLYSYLEQKFSSFDNIEVVKGDVLEVDIPFHNKVVSNIPYTITGPIFEKFFFKEIRPRGILIIEKSIADRVFLSKDYKKISRISIGLNSFMEPVYKSKIARNCFFPIPKIDLSLIKIIPRVNVNPFLLEKAILKYYLKFIAGIMAYKNKNLANALEMFFRTQKENHFRKEEILQILRENNYENKKVVSFNVEDFVKISQLFYNFYK